MYDSLLEKERKSKSVANPIVRKRNNFKSSKMFLDDGFTSRVFYKKGLKTFQPEIKVAQRMGFEDIAQYSPGNYNEAFSQEFRDNHLTNGVFNTAAALGQHANRINGGANIQRNTLVDMNYADALQEASDTLGPYNQVPQIGTTFENIIGEHLYNVIVTLRVTHLTALELQNQYPNLHHIYGGPLVLGGPVDAVVVENQLNQNIIYNARFNANLGLEIYHLTD